VEFTPGVIDQQHPLALAQRRHDPGGEPSTAASMAGL